MFAHDFDPERVKDEYPKFFSHHNPHEDWKPTKVRSFVDRVATTKATLMKALGTDEQGRRVFDAVRPNFQTQFPSTLMSLRAVVLRYMEEKAAQEVVKALNDNEALATNRMNNGAKISRTILKIKDKTHKTKCFSLWNAIRRELPNMPNTKVATKRLELVVQNLFSEIAGETKRLTLSVNPFDILNASNTDNFTSCFRLGGEFGSAPLVMCEHPRVAIGYISTSGEAKKAAGRFWVIFNDNFSEVVVMKPYGTVGRDVLAHLQGALPNLLNTNLGYCDVPDWKVALRWVFTGGVLNHNLVAREAGAQHYIYLDYNCSALLFNKTAGGTKVGFIPKFKKPKCFLCGKTLSRTGSVLCPSCSSEIKKPAKKQTEPEPRPAWWCPVCLKKQEGDAPHTKILGAMVCTTCAEQLLEEKPCAVCGSPETVALYRGQHLCEYHLLKRMVKEGNPFESTVNPSEASKVESPPEDRLPFDVPEDWAIPA